MFKNETISVVKSSGTIPDISNALGNSMSITSQTRNAFITKVNSPRVRILKGKLINFRIGLIEKLTSPNIVPAINRLSVDPWRTAPGMNFPARKMPNIPDNM
tara:strand:+ start:99 stop:404 length:306 start_codon:yes stop_codon:yes gene_type:complete